MTPCERWPEAKCLAEFGLCFAKLALPPKCAAQTRAEVRAIRAHRHGHAEKADRFGQLGRVQSAEEIAQGLVDPKVSRVPPLSLRQDFDPQRSLAAVPEPCA